ncbi:uncharacterized protein LOC110280418 [Arachis duranensis]|nr:uncharacterized protein LOC110280418 [Arachis duranensis]
MEQKKAYDRVMRVVNGSEEGFFFRYGHGGCSKIFIYNLMSAKVRSRGKIVLTVASSGIAPLLLINGRIAHSRFKILITVDEYSTYNIRQGSLLAKLLIKIDLIIWDEAPMLSRYCYEALDICLRDIITHASIANCERPFRGNVVVLGGDFRQILPIITRGSRQDIVHATINSSYLWEFAEVM